MALPLVPEKKKKMKKKKKGVYTEEAITEPRGRFGAYPGSDRVTKAPSKNGETPGIGEGRVAIFPLTHTHANNIPCVCVCVLGSNNITPKENEVQSRIGSSSDPFFFFLSFSQHPLYNFSYIYKYIHVYKNMAYADEECIGSEFFFSFG